MIHYFFYLFFHLLQNALNAQRVAGLIKTAETMGILDTSTESTKQSDIDEILGFLAALEKVQIFNLTLVIIPYYVVHVFPRDIFKSITYYVLEFNVLGVFVSDLGFKSFEF